MFLKIKTGLPKTQSHNCRYDVFCCSMLKAALDVAKQIASKSPVAVQTTKRNMVYSRDHTVQEGLEHIVWC